MIPIPFCLKDERSWIIRCGRVAAGPSLALALVLLALSPPAFASEPEIIRVRVPATQTSKWFPGGTELRVMPAEQFESLVNRDRGIYSSTSCPASSLDPGTSPRRGGDPAF